MRYPSAFVAVAMVIGLLSFGFKSGPSGTPDLSTPQKSYSSFVEILQSGNVSALAKVATPTGQASLVALYQLEEYKAGMTVMGQDLAASEPTWSEITEDIYFASCKIGQKIHKMEFTKEEPGWMLYHWQVGGGADAHGVDNTLEPKD